MSLGMMLLVLVTLGGTIFAFLSKRLVGISDDTINEEYLRAMKAKRAAAQQDAELVRESQRGAESLKERLAIFQQNSSDDRRQAQQEFRALKGQMVALQRRDQQLARQVGSLSDSVMLLARAAPQAFEATIVKKVASGPGKPKTRGERRLMRR